MSPVVRELVVAGMVVGSCMLGIVAGLDLRLPAHPEPETFTLEECESAPDHCNLRCRHRDGGAWVSTRWDGRCPKILSRTEPFMRVGTGGLEPAD